MLARVVVVVDGERTAEKGENVGFCALNAHTDRAPPWPAADEYVCVVRREDAGAIQPSDLAVCCLATEENEEDKSLWCCRCCRCCCTAAQDNSNPNTPLLLLLLLAIAIAKGQRRKKVRAKEMFEDWVVAVAIIPAGPNDTTGYGYGRLKLGSEFCRPGLHGRHTDGRQSLADLEHPGLLCTVFYLGRSPRSDLGPWHRGGCC